jgi:hypothetical protein
MRTIGYVGAVVLLGWMISPAMTSAAQVTVGNAKVVVKTVVGTSGNDQRTLQLLDDVYHNELIETKAESATQLVFQDDTTVTLGPNSKLVLDRFVFDPNQSKGSFIMTATQGVFRFASGKLSSKSYKINTPAGTLGIRGTEFTVAVTDPPSNSQDSDVVVEVSLVSGTVDIVTCQGNQQRLAFPERTMRIVRADDGSCLISTGQLIQ